MTILWDHVRLPHSPRHYYFSSSQSKGAKVIESTNLDFHGQSCGETKVTIRTQTSDGKGACQLQGLKLKYIIERMRNSSGQKPYRSSDRFDTSRRNHASDLNCKVNYLNDSIDELHEKKITTVQSTKVVLNARSSLLSQLLNWLPQNQYPISNPPTTTRSGDFNCKANLNNGPNRFYLVPSYRISSTNSVTKLS